MPPPSKDAFADWKQRLCEGDKGAMGELFDATYPALLRYARGLAGRQVVAQDAVQQTFTKIWQRRGTLQSDGSLRALLYTTVRHRTLNQMRDAKNRSELAAANVENPAGAPSPDRAADAEMLGARIRSWINELPERRREAFRLSRFDQLSYREIAEVMDVSVRTVESHVRHALEHLRGRLQTFEPDRLNE